MSSTPTTPQERFDSARQINNDINSVAELKLAVAANNTGAGIVRTLSSSGLNFRGETEALLNEALVSAINSVLDNSKTVLTTEFENTMTGTVS